MNRNPIAKLQVKSFRQKFQSDSGSAIVEFVALAIPLFIPIFIYLNQFSSVSGNEEIARAMAREVLRVYAISEMIQLLRNIPQEQPFCWQSSGIYPILK